MVELEKRISGDWIELKEKANSFHDLLAALAVPSRELMATATKLRLSVEQGIVEFKRSMLSPVLVALETVRYKSLAGEELAAQEKSLAALLLVIFIQRLVCTDALPVSRPREEKHSLDVGSLQVSAILADVNSRVTSNTALRSNPAIKNILMQVQRYNSENRKMRELLPTIKQEMRRSFVANFSRTFEEIVGSIRRNYAVILQEQLDAENGHREGFSLSLMPLKEFAPLMASQAREVARIRSTLGHARDEKYKTREVLVRLYDGRHAVLKLIEEEGRTYRRICQQTQQHDLEACSLAIANGFRDEIAGILDKQGKRELPA
jgi:hypothetical protein